MADPADRDLHLLRMAIWRRQEISELNEEPCSLARPLELRALYRDVPEALTETVHVAEECNFDLGDAPPILPSFEVPAGETAEARLAAMCRTRLRAAQRTGRCRGPQYEERLRQELSVVERLGYAGYFLIMAEIADRARQLDIAVAGRGSAAGSLMTHLLALTAVDPIERGLYFERFLNPARKELPDIREGALGVTVQQHAAGIPPARFLLQGFGAARLHEQRAPARFTRRRAGVVVSVQQFPLNDLASAFSHWPPRGSVDSATLSTCARSRPSQGCCS